jgi:hypothetical protein
MKNEKNANFEKLLHNLSYMPKKIISLEGNEKTPEFVLHELCNKDYFDLEKAAFFVDSPDFNCLKGIAGFNKSEAFAEQDIWADPYGFIEHMEKASFNQKVRKLTGSSIKNEQLSEKALLKMALELGFSAPAFHSWEMKHANHGYLIYESNGSSPQEAQDHLENSLYLFSFCPIF